MKDILNKLSKNTNVNVRTKAETLKRTFFIEH